MIEFGNDIKMKNAPFLIKSEEGEDNSVRFTVALSICEDTKNTKVDNIEQNFLKDLLKNKFLILKDDKEVYEIVFERYILYQVRNESFCSKDDYDIQQGKFFIVFDKSRLLDMLHTITDCQIAVNGDSYPGNWKHYGIYCQNHIIDIISHNEPVIKKLDIACM